MTTRTRRATTADVGAIVEVVNRAYRVEEFFVTGTRTREADIRRLLSTDGTTFLVIDSTLDDARLAGSVCVRVRGERGYFSMLSVDPDEQGRGLGRVLVADAEAHCRGAGCTAMDIDVVNLREELPAFYSALGYAPSGTAPFPEPGVLRREAHLVVMSKVL
jgi:GNAT superfamily N-acetyltransferase